MERGSSADRLAEIHRTRISHRLFMAVFGNVGFMMRFIDTSDIGLIGCG